MKPAERVQRIFDEAVGSDLTSWEKHQFLPSVRERDSLTQKQEDVLSGIEERLFGDDA